MTKHDATEYDTSMADEGNTVLKLAYEFPLKVSFVFTALKRIRSHSNRSVKR